MISKETGKEEGGEHTANCLHWKWQREVWVCHARREKVCKANSWCRGSDGGRTTVVAGGGGAGVYYGGKEIGAAATCDHCWSS